MCNLDYDRADLYEKINRKARKEHICCECGRIIKKGESYSYVFGVWGKNVSSYRTCSHCLIGQDWLWEQCGGFLHCNLEEEILEHAEDYRRFDLYRFVIGMRKQWNKINIPVLKD